jgi:DNA-binding NarL/FixJ family response regulator
VAQGLSNAEIAKRRFIKEKSVELTISRMAKSLGIESNISANQRVHIARVYFRAIGVKVDI